MSDTPQSELELVLTRLVEKGRISLNDVRRIALAVEEKTDKLKAENARLESELVEARVGAEGGNVARRWLIALGASKEAMQRLESLDEWYAKVKMSDAERREAEHNAIQLTRLEAENARLREALRSAIETVDNFYEPQEWVNHDVAVTLLLPEWAEARALLEKP